MLVNDDVLTCPIPRKEPNNEKHKLYLRANVILNAIHTATIIRIFALRLFHCILLSCDFLEITVLTADRSNTFQ